MYLKKNCTCVKKKINYVTLYIARICIAGVQLTDIHVRLFVLSNWPVVPFIWSYKKQKKTGAFQDESNDNELSRKFLL